MWVGPPETDVTEDFLSIFGAVPGMFATDVVGLDSAVNREDLYREFARLRGIFGLQEGESFANLKIDDIIPVGHKRHLSGYRKFADAQSDKMIIADLSTDPQERPSRHGLVVPTFTKNTTLVKVTSDGDGCALYSPNEVDFLHGWPVLDVGSALTDVMRECIAVPLDLELSRRCRTNFSGNGQHLACMAAWFLYIACNVVRRDVALPASIPPPSSDVSDDTDEPRP